MPAFQDVHGCCGVKIIYGFEERAEVISKWLDNLEIHAHQSMTTGWLTNEYCTHSYVPHMVPGMYMIFLDEKQNDAFSKLLQQHGFELTKGPFKNPRMKNKTKIYIWTRVNKYSWYEKFLAEDVKKIWKPNEK